MIGRWHSVYGSLLIVALFSTRLMADEVRHSLFIAGPTFTGILDESGEVAWDAQHPGARDGYVLKNGHLLIAWAEEVQELTRDRQIVFRYGKSGVNREIGTAQRLPNQNTLITELGSQPRLLEVNPQGAIVVDVPLQPETDNAHMQSRMARKLADGSYLVPHLLAFSVKQYNPEGKVLSSLATDLSELGGRAAECWPFTAIRLENGHTLVTLTHSNQVVEFDSAGRVAWRLTNDDLAGRPLVDPCGAQRLPNGHTVICSYGASDGIKVLEVSPDKELVWSYAGPHRAHEVQVLTTNGEPLTGEPLK